MKHVFLVLLLGLTGATVAHFSWFQLRRPCVGDTLECQLAWMRTELRLTDAQFARIRSLHHESSPRLLALAGQVARMKTEYEAFERERKTVGEIDFIDFARFVEQRRMVDRECQTSTRLLIAATADIMSPEQRTQYLSLLGPVVGTASGAPN